MYHYRVWVRSNKYHSKEALTYYHKKLLKQGTIVKVFLQNNEINALIIGKTDKPRFKTKEISHIYDLPTINPHLINLIKWLIEYYPSNIGVITSHLLPSKLDLEIINKIAIQKSTISKTKLPSLTNDQKKALKSIKPRSTTLIRGRTGSGKTRIYLELALKAFHESKSSIILTPEISLTSQLYQFFSRKFNNNVYIVHSRLTFKEKQIIWLTCLLSDQPIILIGPRSASLLTAR